MPKKRRTVIWWEMSIACYLVCCASTGHAQNSETLHRAMLGAYGIAVNALPPQTEVGGLQQSTLLQLIKFRQEYGQSLTVVGGTEGTGGHATGSQGHLYGWKVDLRINSAVAVDDPLSRYIMNHYEDLGNRQPVSQGECIGGNERGTDRLFKSPRGLCFALEFDIRSNSPSDHWDVYFPIRLEASVAGQVNPLNPIQLSMGQSLQVQAVAKDALNDNIGLVQTDFAWSSTDPTIATVDLVGNVTGVREGSAGILVSHGNTFQVMAFAVRPGLVNIIDLGLVEPVAINASGQVTGITQVSEHARGFVYSQGEFRDLGTLGGLETRPSAMNDYGDIVGYSTTSAGMPHGFLYSNGTMKDLGTLGGDWFSSEATDINNAGQVVGHSTRLVPGTRISATRAFLYSNGAMQALGPVSGANTYAAAINSPGQVLLNIGQQDGSHAFVYTEGNMRDLGTLGGDHSFAQAINDSGDVVGASYRASGETNDFLHAFVYTNGAMRDLGTFGGTFSAAVGINNAGQITGLARRANGENRAFLYSGGVMRDLGTLGGGMSFGLAINNVGEIAGCSATTNGSLPSGACSQYGNAHAFVYSNGVLKDLQPLPNSVSSAVGINDSGQVIGWSKGPSSTRGFLYLPTGSANSPSVSPASGQQGQTINNFTVNGSNFTPTSTLSFSGTGITVNSYSTRTTNRIVASITIASNASVGVRDLIVDIGGSLATSPAGFTITSPDADGDGVSDALDRCPGTALGAQVGANGCSAEQFGKIGVLPTAIDFGPVGLNQTKTKTFLIKNIGPVGSTLIGSITSPPLLPFGVLGTSTFSLQAGQSAAIQVTFLPTVDTNFTDVIGIISNDPVNPSVSIGLTGEVLDRIKVWLNAFIPRDVPPYTSLAPLPLTNGETMIVGPLLIAAPYYLTDQRTFDSNPNGSSRIHSEIEVDTRSLTMNELHRASETAMLGIDPVTGYAVGLCTRTANLVGTVSFSQPLRYGSAIQFTSSGAGSNPCSPPLTPDIDYSGTITINLIDGTVSFNGFIDDFPAFEMYVSANGRQPVPLFREPPAPGNNPWNLIGSARRFISKTGPWFSGPPQISGQLLPSGGSAADPPGLSQNIAPLYGSPFPLSVTGQDFDPSSQVFWDSIPLSTIYENAAQLTATVPSLVAPQFSSVTVVNAGGVVSNVVTVRVVERGDVNGNRSVNIGDALVCALTVGGINKPSLPISVGDLNLNGSVNIGDCLVAALFAGRGMPNVNAPSVTSVSPIPTSPAGTLAIFGTGFGANPVDNQVLFTTNNGGVRRVSPDTASTTRLTVTVPSNASSGPVQVYRVDVPLGGPEFPIEIAGTPTPLRLTTVSPFFQVAIGTSVVLAGLGFDVTPVNNTVRFKSSGGTLAGTVTAATTTSLTVTIPTGALCGPVTVGVRAQTSNSRIVTIPGTNCGLQLVDIWAGGAPGEIVVLEGTGFDVTTPANNLVKFAASVGGTVNGTVVAAGGTQLHVRIPDTATTGNVTVTVGATTSNTVPYKVP